jgi:hypothetical protein
MVETGRDESIPKDHHGREISPRAVMESLDDMDDIDHQNAISYWYTTYICCPTIPCVQCPTRPLHSRRVLPGSGQRHTRSEERGARSKGRGRLLGSSRIAYGLLPGNASAFPPPSALNPIGPASCHYRGDRLAYLMAGHSSLFSLHPCTHPHFCLDSVGCNSKLGR